MIYSANAIIQQHTSNHKRYHSDIPRVREDHDPKSREKRGPVSSHNNPYPKTIPTHEPQFAASFAPIIYPGTSSRTSPSQDLKKIIYLRVRNPIGSYQPLLCPHLLQSRPLVHSPQPRHHSTNALNGAVYAARKENPPLLSNVVREGWPGL